MPCPYGISFDLSGLCPQKLTSRVPAGTSILSRSAAVEGGRRLDVYCAGKVYAALPHRD
jgi:hypothetical protein